MKYVVLGYAATTSKPPDLWGLTQQKLDLIYGSGSFSYPRHLAQALAASTSVILQVQCHLGIIQPADGMRQKQKGVLDTQSLLTRAGQWPACWEILQSTDYQGVSTAFTVADCLQQIFCVFGKSKEGMVSPPIHVLAEFWPRQEFLGCQVISEVCVWLSTSLWCLVKCMAPSLFCE